MTQSAPTSPSETGLEHELISLLREEFEVPDEIGLDSSYDELAFDSLTLIEIAVALSNRYGIEITDEEMSEGGTVRATLDLLRGRGVVG